MKRLSIMIAVLFVSPTWALTFIGPPTSDIKAGQIGIGFDYSHSKFDFRLKGYGLDFVAEDMEANTYFARLLFGVANNAEIYGRFGISALEADEKDGFHSNNDFAWGAGAKIKLGELANLSWGTAFQVISFVGEDTAMIWPYLIKGEFDAYEIQVAVGPSFKMDKLCFYGGPLLHFITGDFDVNIDGLKGSLDVEQESEFGGYIGLGWQFAENSSLNVEYQLTGDADAIGISLIHRFGAPPKPEKYIITQRPTPEPKPKPTPKVDATGRKIIDYRMKRDASGEFIKDEKGHFIFEPVYEDENDEKK